MIALCCSFDWKWISPKIFPIVASFCESMGDLVGIAFILPGQIAILKRSNLDGRGDCSFQMVALEVPIWGGGRYGGENSHRWIRKNVPRFIYGFVWLLGDCWAIVGSYARGFGFDLLPNKYLDCWAIAV